MRQSIPTEVVNMIQAFCFSVPLIYANIDLCVFICLWLDLVCIEMAWPEPAYMRNEMVYYECVIMILWCFCSMPM